jgi:predicted PurR-regulated permease PerM
LFLLLFGGLAVVVPPLIGQGQELVTNAPSYLDRFEQWVLASGNDAIRTYGGRAINRARELLQNPGAFTASGGPFQIEAGQVTQALGFLTSFVGIVFTVVSAMIVAYYWMTEKAIIKRLVLGLFPMDRRDRAHALWDEIEDKLGGWARGQVLLMLIIGGVSTVVYGALGLPSFFLLGIWAGITELIPFIGPFLGGGLAVIVAFTEGWQKAAVVLLFVIVLQQLEGNVIVPRVMRNAVGLTPLSVILAVLVGSTLLGPLGAILAIPVAAAVQVLISELLRTREETDDDEAGSPLIRRLALGLPRRRGAAGGR